MATPSARNGARLRIAVVGSGIAGLSAAWLLQKRHDVTVFEKNDYAGGHSHTVDIDVDGQRIAVDTGFIVYNPVDYPNLVAMFDRLGVPTADSDMSFSASLREGQLEYSGTDLNGLFAQRRNALSPHFWRLLRDLVRFYRETPRLLDDPWLRELTLGELVQHRQYSRAFIDDHLLPMGAAIWSSTPQRMLDFPALAFLRFFSNHGLVQLRNRPEWRTVRGGSREYVQRLLKDFAGDVHLARPIERIDRSPGGCVLHFEHQAPESFDHVVVGTHSDEALNLLAAPSDLERDVLGTLHYQTNRVILHRDTRFMPSNRRAWASWNYIDSGGNRDPQALSVTYWMNSLQPLGTQVPVLITLNPQRDIDSQQIFAEFDYAHPVFDSAALAAQPRLWDLQGQNRTWFCGAYFGSGFHEDGIQAGLEVAEMLGDVHRPWIVPNASGRVRQHYPGSDPRQRSERAA